MLNNLLTGLNNTVQSLSMLHFYSNLEKTQLSLLFGIIYNVPRTVRQKEAVEEKSARIKSRPVVELGVMNCRSVDNKLDYIFDYCKDNNLDT